jgi:UDPglucose 6-dehydrogenase
MKIFSTTGKQLEDSVAPKIAVVGLQHQGQILAACFADMGYKVTAIDADPIPIKPVPEPNLDDLIDENKKNGRLRYVGTDYDTVKDVDFVFLSIDVPFNENGLNLDSVFDATYKIREFKSSDTIVCITSQLPVGTSEKLFDDPLAYIPELLRPGQSVQNFRHPDRIIIGANDPIVGDRVEALYKPLNSPILRMSIRSAEMSKHAHNAMLATQISFANEMAALCKKVGADPVDVAKAVKMDRRVGLESYVNPGWSLKNGHLIRDVRVIRNLQYENELYTGFMGAILHVDERL